MIRLHAGDCREILKTLDADSVDACVTDPPYELDFMGKAWDRSGVAFDPATWREVFRVLKPGAHLLAFGGTRTHHRLICAIEDAGFEIRDCLGWLYGSGFPKSLDVAKALDKMDAGELRHARRLQFTAWLRSTGITAAQIDEATRSFMSGHYLSAASQPAVATRSHFEAMRPLFSVPVPDWVEAMVDERTVESENMKRREVIGKHDGEAPGVVGDRFNKTRERFDTLSSADITAPFSNLARAWAGWGTALKPAWEPVCMARKPFRGTVAENVARHGVGAVNIDGCRVLAEKMEPNTGRGAVPARHDADKPREPGTVSQPSDLGRWPANILHDGSDEVVALFPQSDGAQGTVTGDEPSTSTRNNLGLYGDRAPSFPRNDTGSAARFFYCPKTSPAERDDGLAHLDPVAFARSTGAQTAVAAGTEYQTETGGGYNRVQRVRNTHPTVKPTDLMGYLCRLVTPPGGTVLDPFCGSGSTGRGAVREQFHFVGIDLDPQNIAIAEARIHAAAPLFARAAE